MRRSFCMRPFEDRLLERNVLQVRILSTGVLNGISTSCWRWRRRVSATIRMIIRRRRRIGRLMVGSWAVVCSWGWSSRRIRAMMNETRLLRGSTRLAMIVGRDLDGRTTNSRWIPTSSPVASSCCEFFSREICRCRQCIQPRAINASMITRVAFDSGRVTNRVDTTMSQSWIGDIPRVSPPMLLTSSHSWIIDRQCSRILKMLR
mmetsp:Transcript_29998/g.56282  ORF Transcript_29998/g.56282 Transcript_29998/m.56282 type:complete len:204 (+) Transcript_29998:1581-2192(+)